VETEEEVAQRVEKAEKESYNIGFLSGISASYLTFFFYTMCSDQTTCPESSPKTVP
jgi:hypothetical protein